MSKIVFHGEGAGLGRVQKNGDANSLSNYVIECGCGTTLVLGGNRPDAEGRLCVGCPKCEMATVVSKDAQVLAVVPIAAIRKMQIDNAKKANAP